MTFSAGSDTVDSDFERPVETYSRRRVMRVLVVAILAFAALVGWSFASPIGASPDDNFHQVSIWCAPGDRTGLCESTGDPETRLVPSILADSSLCFAFVPEHSGKCDTPPSGMVTTDHGNFTGAYPPVYYRVMSVFTSDDVQTSVLLIRVFNSLLAVSLVTSLYLLLDRRLRGAMLWSLLLTAIPMGIFLVSSINPSGWAIMSAATTWVAIVGFFRAPTRVKQIALGALALVAALMGAGSRGDSAAYVAFGALIAAIITFERSRRYLLSLIVPLVAIAMSAAFYLGAGQAGMAVGGEMSDTPTRGADFVAAFIRTLVDIPKMWVGNFGMQPLGWGDVEIPSGVWFTTTVLFGAVAFWALSRKRDARLNVAIVLAGIALVMIPSWVITQNGVEVGVLVQPRYILPLQVLFIGVLLLGGGDIRRDTTRVQRWVIVIGLAAANSIALYVTMRRFLTGTAYRGFDLNNGVQWWWDGMAVPPGFFWILGSVAFAALLMCVTGVLMRQTASDAIVETPTNR